MRAQGQPLGGRRVLVTGGSSGIGAAAAVALRGAGASVALTGRSTAALASVASRCDSGFLAADLRVPEAAESVVGWACHTLGGLDTVVCAAGSGWAGPFEKMTDVDIDAMIDVNLRVPMQTVRAALGALRDSPYGGVVLVGSIVGLVGVAEEVAYSAAKAGLAGFADALRLELGDTLAVSLISPAAVNTPFFDRRNRPYERRWPQPMPVERVAEAIVRAVITGQPSRVIPSWMTIAAKLHGVAPGLYRVLARRFA